MIIPPLPSFWESLLVFVSMLVYEISWVFCVRRVNQGKILAAGLWSITIFVSSAISTIGYVINHWLLAIAALAAFIGTTVAIYIDKHK